MNHLRVCTVLLAAGLVAGSVEGKTAEAPIHAIACSSTRTSEAYERGLHAYYRGQLEEARAELDRAGRREPKCALVQWALSRVEWKAGHPEVARAASERAVQAAPESADDREQKLVADWASFLKAQGQGDAERSKSTASLRDELDRDIAIYPEEPEFLVLRGDVAENPIRSAPFYLSLKTLQPRHPLLESWKPSIPAPPDLKPSATNPVADVAAPPPLFEGLGNLSHPITTHNPLAQKYYDQGLRCFHAYVMPGRVKNSAAWCFQHAANLDPQCAMAYWGLSFCPTDAMTQVNAANRALELALASGNDKEHRYAAARVLELSGGGKREAFLDALDGAIAAYPDDVELWIWRGKVYGVYGYSTGTLEGMPYQLTAHRMHPEHSAPNHELIHAYEEIDRPALGWPFTLGFRASAPNLPHAHHMQAHLAMRLGRWQEAIDCTRMSRRKSLDGFPELDPSHHIDILIRALGHEGRFHEAESEPRAYRDGLPWARLLQLKAVPEELDEWIARRANTPDGAYLGAVSHLNRGDLAGSLPLIAKVEEQWKKQPMNIYRYNEVRGRYLVQNGQPEEGLKLLREAADKAVKDSGLHAWGGGSYMLEAWGEAALRVHRWDEAEQAFSEALAHEHGSIVGALGLQVVWEHRDRSDMVAHYAARAAAIWQGADAGALERQLQRLRAEAGNTRSARG